MNWNVMLKGLISALSGGLTAGSAAAMSGRGDIDWAQIGIVAGVAAAAALGNYLKSPPQKTEVVDVPSQG